MGEDHSKPMPPEGGSGSGGGPGLPPRVPSAGAQGAAAGRKSHARSILEFIGIILLAVVLAYLLQAYLVKPFQIPSSSMEPALVPGDRVLVNRLAYRYGSPQRGDIIVFRSPNDPNVDFIKRVIAVGGDTVEIREGMLLVNGEPQVEDYVKYADTRSFHFQLVPQGMVFVLGDNRPDSQDARYWKNPWLPESEIIGKAFFRYWPLSRIGTLD
jgi:signal peptidase I